MTASAKRTPPLPSAPSPAQPAGDSPVRQDTVTMSLLCDRGRWHATVTLGTVRHDLGVQPTASDAMNAAMRFYYLQRPRTRRRTDQERPE